MPAFTLRHVAFCISWVLGCWPLAAQSSNYHVEFEPRGPRSYSHLVLVNDSEKAIEAYSVLQVCGRSAQFAATILSNGQTFLGTSGVIEPGERRTLRGGWTYRPDVPSCDAQVEAVILTDGSFEGKDAPVRGLKALGDGEAASIHYWADRIKAETPDGSTLGLLLDEIKRRIAQDEAEQRRYPNHLDHVKFRPLWEYWEGKKAVDFDIESQFPRDLSSVEPTELLQRVTNYVEKRKAEIDGNEVMQKLNAIFPQISEPKGFVNQAPDGSTP